MRILVEPEFDEELMKDLELIYSKLDKEEQYLFNDPVFLKSCYNHFKNHFECLIVTAHLNRTIGCFIFRLQIKTIGKIKRLVYVPINHQVSDFSALLVEPKFRIEFIKNFKRFLISSSHHFLLHNLLLRQDEEVALCKYLYHKLPNPVARNHDQFFKQVISKKSLKRHANWFQRTGSFEVFHRRVMNRSEIEEFIRLHKERWSFLNVRSKFYDGHLGKFYRDYSEIAASGYRGKGLLFTELRYNKELVAAHIGYTWGSTLLYHIPVINIKYLDKWPGEVLIQSLFKYAVEQEYTVVDLGYGDEHYKSRFANDVLYYPTYIFPKNLFHKLIWTIPKRFSHLKNSRFLTLFSFWNVVTGEKVAKKLKSAILGTPMVFFDNSGIKEKPPYQIRKLDFQQYLDYCRTNVEVPYPCTKRVWDRFKAGYILHGLAVNNELVSFAWTIEKKALYISEMGKTITLDKPVVWIIDCFTLEEHRGKGFYPNLLNSIVYCHPDRRHLIYSKKSNLASLLGIQKANFNVLFKTRFGKIHVTKGSSINAEII